jgi:hypothetical protein
MIVKMLRTITGIAALLAAGFLVGCGTASDGSKAQASTGVSSSGYPAGQPKDPGSPALSSSSESQYSRDQAEKTETLKQPEPAKK